MDQELISAITNNRYPRGFATPYRCNFDQQYYIVHNPEDLVKYISKINEINGYLTVYSFYQYDQDLRECETARIDTIPFDFDDEENPANSLQDVRKLLSWCERHDIEPRITYSANKGFHLFIDTEIMHLREPRFTLKRFFKQMQAHAKFTTADPVVIGDLDRVIRIPNTIHKSTGRYCIPLSPIDVKFLDMEDIVEMSRQKSDYIPERKPIGDDHEIIEYIYSLDAQVSEEIKETKRKQKESKKLPFSNVICGTTGGCPACEYYLENGAIKGERDLAVCGIVQRLKGCHVSENIIYQKLMEFNEKCRPQMKVSDIDSKFRYHMSHDYSPCTFLINMCTECAKCDKLKR